MLTLLLCLLPVADQPTFAAGTVRNADGTPAVDATVHVRRGPEVVTSTADAEGRFRIDVPAVGQQDFTRFRFVSAAGDAAVSGLVHESETGAKSLDAMDVTLQPASPQEVRVRDSDGRPVADAWVGFYAGWSIGVPASTTSDVRRTDARGTATFLIADSLKPVEPPERAFFALKPDVGLDYRMSGTTRDGREGHPVVPGEPVTLTLEGIRPAQSRFTDARGELVRPKSTYIWLVRKPGEIDELNLSFLPDVQRQMVRFEDGAVVYPYVPVWQTSPLTTWTDAEGFIHQRGRLEPGAEPPTVVMRRLVYATGRVVDESGDPVEGAVVHVSGDGYAPDEHRSELTTDADGRFTDELPPDLLVQAVAKTATHASEVSKPQASVPGRPFDFGTLTLRPGTPVIVTLSDEAGNPRGGESVSIGQEFTNLRDSGVTIPNPEGRSISVQPTHWEYLDTDAEGRARFLAGVGDFYVFGTQQQPAKPFSVTAPGGPAVELNFTAADPYVDLTVLVVDGDAPAAGAAVRGTYGPVNSIGMFRGGFANDDGVFTVRRETLLTHVFAADADRSKVGLTLIGPDETETLVDLQPSATVAGRLVHADDGTPLANEPIRGRLTIRDDDSGLSMHVFGPRLSTDADGNFTATGLVPGWEYWLHLRSRKGNAGYPGIGRVTPDGPETINLGTVRLSNACDLED